MSSKKNRDSPSQPSSTQKKQIGWTMTNEEKVSAGGGDRNSDTVNANVIWNNVKDLLFKVNLDDVLYFCICFISIAIVPLAAIGNASYYYELTVNIRPISESVVDDLNCSDRNITAEYLDQSVCSMNTFETKYSLFHRQINYFHFTPNFGVSFCEHHDYAYTFLQKATTVETYFGTEEMPEETEELLGGGNIGDCSETTMLTAAAFASLTMAFAFMGLLWFTVLSHHYGSTRAAIAHVALSSVTMICSLITIAIFWITINPLRSSIDPTFCDGQSVFEDCEEAVGIGFYCQVATAVLSFVQILVYASTSRVKASAITLSCCGKDEGGNPEALEADTLDPSQPINPSHRPRFFKNPHFWIKLGRFLEFFLATVSAMISFTTLEVLLPNADDTSISMSSYLWGDQFCSDGFFAIDVFRLAEDDDETTMDLKNFGDCKPFYKYKIIFTIIKIVVSGGMALFLKRDAAKNPLFYLGGLCADVATIFLVCIAIVVFMTQIYPGRNGIKPSFCDQYSELRNAFLDDNDESPKNIDETCEIYLGAGFYVLCVVLVLTVVNLLTEFFAGEIGSEYGAWNAYNTVLKRVRRREFQSALFGPSSYYVAKEFQRESTLDHSAGGGDPTSGNSNPKLSNVIESKEDVDPNSTSPKHDETILSQ